MNRLPPQPGPPEDADERYRRASALDPSRPSEAVRRAILANAAQLSARPSRSRASRLWWRPALFGTLAAAALAGLLIVPRYLAPAPGGSGEGVLSANASKAAAVVPPAEQEARSAPSAAPSSREFMYVQPQRPADSRRAVGAPSADAAAKAPRVASRQQPANTTDETTARQDSPGYATPSPEGAARMRAQAGSSAAVAGRSALAAPAPSSPTDAETGEALRRAAESGDLVALQGLMRAQVVLNSRDAEGRTALMLAALHGQGAVVNTLLQHGADPNIPDLRGTTPLAAALAAGHLPIAEALQRHGAR